MTDTVPDAPPPDALIDALVGVVGEANVLTDAAQRAGYETDWSRRFHGVARCVVRPADTAEVAETLRRCETHDAAVVTQGGNTGLVGGSVPRDREVVLSLQRLDRIEALDADHGEVVVGAGVPLAAAQDAARSQGWDVGVDFAARDAATIGGMVATNAGGLHLLRYGPMRDQVIGLEAVRANGDILGRMPALRKDNTGYHWPSLLAGSEGTLAVITQVHLRLVPALPDRIVVVLGVEDVAAAIRVVGHVRRAIPSLLAAEMCFADGVDLVCEHTGIPWPLPERTDVLVTLEVAGPAGSRAQLHAELETVLDGTTEIRQRAVALDEPERTRLWTYREHHSEALNALGLTLGAPHKLDVTLPFAALAEFPARVRAAIGAVAPEARVVIFGHLGDGNLHVNVIGPDPDDETVDRVVLELVAGLGGSISAEHGIGIAKRELLHLSRSAADLEAMHDVKAAMDPSWRLNPGVLLAPPRRRSAR